MTIAVLVIDMTDTDITDIEQRLRDAMSASVAGARPSFGTDDVRRRGRRHRKRATAVSAAAAVAAAFAALAAVAVGLPVHGPSAPVSAALTRRFTDPDFGWQIRYPRGWVPVYFHQQGVLTADGVRVTSFAPNLSKPSRTASSMNRPQVFPAHGVAVQVWFAERAPKPPPPRDSGLPLREASFTRIPAYAVGGEPRTWDRVFYADGFEFNAAVWLGRDAGRAAERAAWAIVYSLRFPALRKGTIWHDRFYVLGLARRYPVGSVTAFPASSLPRGLGRSGFYLIHAPRAFYAVAGTFARSVGSKSTCAVAFDAKARQFFCPGTTLRWDITGRPLDGSAPGNADGGLSARTATVAQDGHVLYSPIFDALVNRRLIGNPWSASVP